MGWKSFNDRLALVLIFLIPALWVLQGWGKVALAPEVVGALIATWTLIIQFYFRKKPEE